jgi:hypothetical protein
VRLSVPAGSNIEKNLEQRAPIEIKEELLANLADVAERRLLVRGVPQAEMPPVLQLCVGE